MPMPMPPGGKTPKLEDLGVKVEPAGAAAAVADKTLLPAAVGTATITTAPAAAATPAGASGSLMPKQRLLIKIPRAAVTAATANAAEVAAAAAAAAKKEDGDTRAGKRGKGKSGVKRARPLAGTRASLPPPPPPAPTSRQVRRKYA